MTTRVPFGNAGVRLVRAVVGLICALSLSAAAEELGPLRPCDTNPRYFATPDGRPLLLAGLHDAWELQDYAWGDTPGGVCFDWPAFLACVQEHDLNLIRLWVAESTRIDREDDALTKPMP